VELKRKTNTEGAEVHSVMHGESDAGIHVRQVIPESGVALVLAVRCSGSDLHIGWGWPRLLAGSGLTMGLPCARLCPERLYQFCAIPDYLLHSAKAATQDEATEYCLSSTAACFPADARPRPPRVTKKGCFAKIDTRSNEGIN
jgi:hypothetical protein